MADAVRIMIVDDHALVREILAERLQRQSGFSIVALAATGDEAVEMVSACQPDVVLLDVDMPGLICFDAARRMRSLCARAKIIFLSAFTQDHYIEQALKANATGYLTKNEPPETIAAAIHEVASGGAYFSAEVRCRVVIGPEGPALAADMPGSPLSRLTPREIETLRYIATGLSKKQIAGEMGVSVKTVERHASNLMNKLDIHDRVELARVALREGITQP